MIVTLIGQLIAMDRALFLFLNSTVANPVFDGIFVNATEARFWIVPGILAALLFIVKKRREALIVIGCAMLTVAITDQLATQLLKPLFHRDRPCPPGWVVEGGRFLCGSKHSCSFPSSHAMNIFAQATLLSFFYPRWRWVYFSFACFIGYSRIYVGVHYPADVAAGAIFGMAVAIGVVAAYRAIAGKLKSRQPEKNTPSPGVPLRT
jgi:undecaprenyl-diphosphatase